MPAASRAKAEESGLIRVSSSLLKELAETEDGPFISLYAPVYHSPDRVKETLIRLRNALRKADEALESRQLRRADRERTLEPLADLIDHWNASPRPPAKGLAFFLGGGRRDPLFLHHAVEESVHVGDAFYLKPLASQLVAGDSFWLLCLSKKLVKLYECDATSHREMALPDDVPASLDEHLARAGTTSESAWQHHGAPSGKRPGTETGVRHGQGARKDAEEHFFEDFARAVARGVKDAITEAPEQPLILVAVEEHHPVFRTVFGEDSLLEEGVHGSPDGVDVKEFLSSARQIVERHSERRFESLRGLYGDLAANDRATESIDEVLCAARDGRVATLFAAADEAIWGRFDASSGETVTHTEAEKNDEDLDLLDLALRHTLKSNGKVHVVPREKMPGLEEPAAVAAILRW